MFGVSIHATLAGGDTGFSDAELLLRNVSIHATLAGGDSRNATPGGARSVSIHATLAGGDNREDRFGCNG